MKHLNKLALLFVAILFIVGCMLMTSCSYKPAPNKARVSRVTGGLSYEIPNNDYKQGDIILWADDLFHVDSVYVKYP